MIITTKIKKIFSFLSNNNFKILLCLFLFYISSWFLWLSPINIDHKTLFTQNVSNVYYYQFGVGAKVLNKASFLKFNQRKAERVLHLIYAPLECVASFFNYHYTKEFCLKNLEIIKRFNASPESVKIEIYKSQLTPFYNIIFDTDNNIEARLKRKWLGNEKKIGMYDKFKKHFKGTFSIDFFLIFNTHITLEQFNDDEYESFIYSYYEYQQAVIEISKFTKWFNKVNITAENLNFDKEFVESYLVAINEIEVEILR